MIQPVIPVKKIIKQIGVTNAAKKVFLLRNALSPISFASTTNRTKHIKYKSRNIQYILILLS